MPLNHYSLIEFHSALFRFALQISAARGRFANRYAVRKKRQALENPWRRGCKMCIYIFFSTAPRDVGREGDGKERPYPRSSCAKHPCACTGLPIRRRRRTWCVNNAGPRLCVGYVNQILAFERVQITRNRFWQRFWVSFSILVTKTNF